MAWSRAGIYDGGSSEAIGAFYEVYNTLGFGFLEHIYVMALERELRNLGHQVRREVGVCVMYKGDELGYQRLDMIVDDKLIIEVKSTYELHKAARRQLYNYLRATNLEVGILSYCTLTHAPACAERNSASITDMFPIAVSSDTGTVPTPRTASENASA